ncbi:hypothetical protein [Actinoplanes sp. NPDC026623]|uniref:hypothetical protein n=1 Tax=Actinoplanes sp. NPDC026623 TaxID=3155610 RepID=UPI0033ED76C3
MTGKEGDATGQGGGSDIGGGGPGATEISALLAYMHHWVFETDGDLTQNTGYRGDKFGKARVQADDPHTDGRPSVRGSLPAHPHQNLTIIPAPQTDSSRDSFRSDTAGKSGPLVDLTSRPYSREAPAGGPRPGAPFSALRQPSLLAAPDLLAERSTPSCNPERTSCLPPTRSDASSSSADRQLQAEMDESFLALQDLAQKKASVMGAPQVAAAELATRAAQIAASDEYKLGYAVASLRDHPPEVTHSPVLNGLGHMARGAVVAGGSGLVIYGSGGLVLLLGGAMGVAAGTAEFASGFAMAVSGAESKDVLRMSGQLEYVFDLTASPSALALGTTGLVISDGDMDVSHGLAVAGDAAEGLSRFRGDPSKLYSGIGLGSGKRSQAGSSVLLLKDVKALGYTARASTSEVVFSRMTRDFTASELEAIEAFRTEVARSGRLDLAGAAAHRALGAAGPGGGVDVVRSAGAFQQEYKFHGSHTGIETGLMDLAATQSLNYSIKYQLDMQRLELQQLVPIRSVVHIWVSPTDAAKYVK